MIYRNLGGNEGATLNEIVIHINSIYMVCRVGRGPIREGVVIVLDRANCRLHTYLCCGRGICPGMGITENNRLYAHSSLRFQDRDLSETRLSHQPRK
jgi:hypothetical protein